MKPPAYSDIVLGLLLTGSLLAIGVVMAFSQGHQHPAADVALHEKFYLTWTRPQHRNVSCCNNKDCYPATFKSERGHWFAQRREDGQWMSIPSYLLEHNNPDPRESPDGNSHVCMQRPGNSDTIFCAVLGSMQ